MTETILAACLAEKKVQLTVVTTVVLSVNVTVA